MIIKTTFILYTVFIAGVSLVPSELSPDISLWDKGSHFIAYMIFALIASGVSRNKKTLAYLSLGIIIYSGILETVQSIVPGRMMSGRDLLANTLGVVAGSLLSLILKDSILKMISDKNASP
jgi:VanZ family protein